MTDKEISSNAVPLIAAKFTIMLVDDQPAILAGLKELIESTGIAEVIATETKAAAALLSALIHRPDIVMLDVSFPEVTGIDIARDLVEKWQDIRILAVSAHDNELYVRSMFDAGACGYMLKDHAPSEMKYAIQAIMDGSKWIGQGLIGHQSNGEFLSNPA